MRISARTVPDVAASGFPAAPGTNPNAGGSTALFADLLTVAAPQPGVTAKRGPTALPGGPAAGDPFTKPGSGPSRPQPAQTPELSASAVILGLSQPPAMTATSIAPSGGPPPGRVTALSGPGGSALTLAAAEPDATIEVYVSPTGARGEAPRRAFALDELGMFGLRESWTSGDIAPSQGSVGPSAFSAAAGEMATASLSATPSITASPVGATPPDGSAAVAADFDPMAAAPLARQSAAPTQGLSAVATPAKPIAADDAEAAHATDGPAGPDLFDPSRAQARPKSAVSLLVTEKNGALQVVAGSSALNADAAGRLRRLIEATAGEFGKRLGTVSLNGLPIDKAAPGTQGEPGWR